MTTFSKKNNRIFLILSLFLLIFSSILIMFSVNLTQLIYNFLKDVVFKRDFDFSKWADTINSLLAFPIFIVVFFDSLFFIKFDNKSKLLLILSYSLLIVIIFNYSAFTSGYHSMDSDMASEILLAKECYLHKTFLPRSWNYSTEIRMLNTQIFTAPLFIFTRNLNSIKAISSFIISLLLPLSLWFLLNELKIKTNWIKALSLLLIFAPWSDSMWKFVQYGSYYVPHIAIAFSYIALFISITYNKNDISQKKYIILLILFLSLSFISGLSGIRYILYFELPLMITILGLKVSKLFKTNTSFNFKNFFIYDKECHLSIVSFLLGAFGYVCNNLVLARFYSFSDFNTTAFTHIGDVKIEDVHNAIMETLGYKNNVSVFTPSGVNNVLLYVGLSFFLIALFKFLKKNENTSHKTFVIFVIVLFVFNSFIFINTEYIARYFILILAFIFPCISLFLDSGFISAIHKYFVGLCFSIVVISNSFIVFESSLCSKEISDKESVAKFLNESNYNCGYATFWNANVFNFLTNDKLQVANLYRYKDGDTKKITDHFKCDKWLTPDSYYTENFGNNENIILIVTTQEYEESIDANVFKNGNLVFTDDYYKVFEYPSNSSFINAF